MDNFFDDENLSWKAKGILCFLLSRLENSVVSQTELIEVSKDGKDSVKNGINELIEKGYIFRYQSRSGNGKNKKWIYKICSGQTEKK